MRCGNCGTDNPHGLKFCNQCGSPLRVHCAKCGFDNAAGARFCGDCGALLAAGSGATPSAGAASVIASAVSQ